MEISTDLKIGFQAREMELLESLREISRSHRADMNFKELNELTLGQRIADAVAAMMGSWTFIIIQSVALFLWMVLNVTAYIRHWDPYPFILLNLALSFQAAYAAPFIMMSQNRQQDIDRLAAKEDYKINLKAELEIELLHSKIDQMRETEIMNLTQTVEKLTSILDRERPEEQRRDAAIY